SSLVLSQSRQYPVHEGSGALGRIRLGQPHRFVDHHRGGCIRHVAKLLQTQTEDGAVDHRHALDTPMGARLGYLPVEFVEVLEDTLDETPRLRWQLVERAHITGAIGLVERLESQVARLSPGFAHTRVKYSPLRVSTFTRSPCSTNRGAFTTSPVSSVTGLVAPVRVSPLTPGSASVTSSSTAAGKSTPIGVPL